MRFPAGARLNGRNVGGQFASLDGLYQFAQETDDADSLIELIAALPVSIRGVSSQGVRTVEDAAFARLDRLSAEEEVEEEEEEEEEPDEDVSSEWEIAFDYNGKKGRTSDVDINIRIQRLDGGAFGLGIAREVLRYVRANQSVPVGFAIAGIDWRRPQQGSHGWRHGDVSDLAMLYAPMYTHGRDVSSWQVHPVKDGFAFGHWRFGSIKR